MARSDTEDSGQKLSEWHPCRNVAVGEVIRRFSLRYSTSSHIRKHLCEQYSSGDTHKWRHNEQSKRRGRKPEQSVIHLIDRDGEEHCGESRDDSYEDRENEKQLVLSKP